MQAGMHMCGLAHYSITLSARTSMEFGILMPGVLAVQSPQSARPLCLLPSTTADCADEGF